MFLTLWGVMNKVQTLLLWFFLLPLFNFFFFGFGNKNGLLPGSSSGSLCNLQLEGGGYCNSVS